MTDYSAHDIHRLDQAYPDALADIERFTGNPANKRRLAEVGPEVYAAELTRDLAVSIDKPMSLAGWAAIATVRLMDAGKTWEEDTDLAYEQRDAARAMADELRAECDKLRAQVADLADKLHKANAQVHSLEKATTAYANENAKLKDASGSLVDHIDVIRAHWATLLPRDVGETLLARGAALAALLPNDQEPCPICSGNGCPDCREDDPIDPQGTGWTQGDNFHADREAVA